MPDGSTQNGETPGYEPTRHDLSRSEILRREAARRDSSVSGMMRGENPRRNETRRRWIRGEKIGPAFWTITSIVSLLVNVILIVLLLSLGQQLFSLKALVEDQLIGGLYQNFVMMDQAHIRTTIPVTTEVPAKFDLPLNTATTVKLTADTPLVNATIYELNAGNALYIPRANTNIVLPAGTELPVQLDLVVPVDQKIPVALNVNVDIPLNQTELHAPFVGLQKVIEPYYQYLDTLPDSWDEVLCASGPNLLCSTFAYQQ
jgi:hypothetical protein